MHKIAIIEDDTSTRTSLVKFIESFPDLICLVAASNVQDFWNRIPERASLHILLIDIDMPGQSGLEALPALHKRFPEADLIMYTQSEDSKDLLKAVHLGATGYLLKDFPLSELRQHIDTILDGGAAMSSKMARKMIEYLNPPKRISDNPKVLSPREEQIIRLLAEGNTYDEIATLLHTGVNGIKYHIKNIYRKMNVDNRLDAIRFWKDET